MSEAFLQTALLALLIDLILGWPERFYRAVGHPVGLFAAIIVRCEGRWNDPARSPAQRHRGGELTLLILVILAGSVAWVVQLLLLRCGGLGSVVLLALVAYPGLAARSLHRHVREVRDPLRRGDLPAARQAVAMIVGRDTEELDEAAVSRAATESLAESFCDGVVAPLFWLCLSGLPGIWIYKAVNTADSMIGHREERWRDFGRAAARFDDVLNFLPARLAAFVICLGGFGGWRVMWRDGGKHASPNAGWPEAAMAGALGLRLGGPVSYDGVLSAGSWIGDGRAAATVEDLDRALGLHGRALVFLLVILGGLAWAL